MIRSSRLAAALFFFSFALAVATEAAAPEAVTLVFERSDDGLQTWRPVATTFMPEGLLDVPVAGQANSVFRMRVQRLSDAKPEPAMVQVAGGTFGQDGLSPHAGQSVGAFAIGKYEVTKAEWDAVLTYAVAKGYDIEGIGSATTANHPIVNVGWKDIAKWCNAKSEMDSKTPVYTTGGLTFKRGNANPVASNNANGYRLPTSIEWEWAFRGGTQSLDYTYSGGNALNGVAWYQSNNSPNGTKPVGQKLPNEIGIHDMSGNVSEWCFDATLAASGNVYSRGGDFGSATSDCVYWFRSTFISGPRTSDHGFRLASNIQ
jgi:formylglycine-generating enzyme required for sulfatase activity